MHHSSNSQEQVNFDPAPKEQVRGVYIPIDIWRLVEEERLSFIEFRLLLYVENRVRCKGIGCWASNARIAKDLNRSPNHVSAMVSKLKDLGLVYEVGELTLRNLKYRILETCWSRVLPDEEDRTELEIRIEKHLTDEFKCHVEVCYFQEKKLLERNPTLTKNRKGSLPRNRKHIIPLSGGRKNKKKRSRSQANDGDIVSKVISGKPTLIEQPGWEKLTANDFYRFVKKAGKLDGNHPYRNKDGKLVNSEAEVTSRWALIFGRMRHKYEPKRIKRVLVWYKENINGRLTPHAFCAKSFNNKFPAIERMMKTFHGETDQDKNVY